MAKTKEELNILKQEYESLTNKLKELTEDELNMVVGGKGGFNGDIDWSIEDESVPVNPGDVCPRCKEGTMKISMMGNTPIYLCCYNENCNYLYTPDD